jgi:hypothetical protein
MDILIPKQIVWAEKRVVVFVVVVLVEEGVIMKGN